MPKHLFTLPNGPAAPDPATVPEGYPFIEAGVLKAKLSGAFAALGGGGGVDPNVATFRRDLTQQIPSDTTTPIQFEATPFGTQVSPQVTKLAGHQTFEVSTPGLYVAHIWENELFQMSGSGSFRFVLAWNTHNSTGPNFSKGGTLPGDTFQYADFTSMAYLAASAQFQLLFVHNTGANRVVPPLKMSISRIA